MTRQTRVPWTGIAGLALIVTAVAMSSLLFLQPWVSCEYEDSSVGCGVPDELRTWTYAAWVLVLLTFVCGFVMTARAARFRA